MSNLPLKVRKMLFCYLKQTLSMRVCAVWENAGGGFLLPQHSPLSPLRKGRVVGPDIPRKCVSDDDQDAIEKPSYPAISIFSTSPIENGKEMWVGGNKEALSVALLVRPRN